MAQLKKWWKSDLAACSCHMDSVIWWVMMSMMLADIQRYSSVQFHFISRCRHFVFITGYPWKAKGSGLEKFTYCKSDAGGYGLDNWTWNIFQLASEQFLIVKWSFSAIPYACCLCRWLRGHSAILNGLGFSTMKCCRGSGTLEGSVLNSLAQNPCLTMRRCPQTT